jgi:oligopeptide transport system substrate-binding protein
MKKVSKSLLAGMLICSMAGCSIPSGTASNASSGTDSSSMTVAIGAQFDTLDPALSTTVYNQYVITSIYDGLYTMDENNEPQLELAKSVETSEDGKTWTFHLRDDVTFNDGKTKITSANYVYAYLRALSYGADNAFAVNNLLTFIQGAKDYNTKALAAGSSFDCTKEDHSSVGIEAPDDYTLVLKLNNPVTFLPVDLCDGSVFSPLPLDTPQHTSDWSLTPGYLTCGEYNLDSISVNDKAVISKNKNFYKADQVTMNQITYQVIADTEAQTAAFKSGDVDVALSISTEAATSYKDTDNLWAISIPSTYSLVLNCGPTGPEYLKDVNVRKALYEAIDKDALVDVIGGSDLYPTLEGYVPFGLQGADGDFREERDKEGGYTLSYNPDEAKELLAKAGYDSSNPLKITYKYSNNSFHGDIATMLQQMWQAVGIDVTFDAVESGVYYSQIDSGDVEIGRYGLQTSDSPLTMLKNWTNANLVTPLVDDATYDAMIDEAQTIADPTEFANKLHEAEDYLVQTMCYEIPLFQFSNPALVSSNLKGYCQHSTTLYFSKCTKTA